MAEARSLVKDSTIYGGSTILVKIISWLMTPLFTYFTATRDVGMITNLYAYAALFSVILTFGIETGFFRFVNQAPKEKKGSVYSTALAIVGAIVVLFLFIFLVFLERIHPFLWDSRIPDSYLRMIVIVLSLDAFIAVPFAFLRYEKKPIRFGFFKLFQVILYALFCVFFLAICPRINQTHPEWIAWFWKENYSVGYVLISNLIATGTQTLCLLPELTGFKFSFDRQLAKKMLHYCFPLMLMGLAGMSNQVVDKIIFPAVYPDPENAMSELGIYGACFKIGVIMVMFTQAFRYAFDPFMFEKSKEKDAQESYATIMKYFVIVGLLVFLGVTFYLDIIKYMVVTRSEYFAGLPVVPVVLMGELFFSVYYNLSLWYKLTDKTYWGTVFSTIGFVLIIVLNIVFIPKYGYMACAWASFAGNGLIMVLSYVVGQKYYPVRYDLKTLFFYSGVALLLYGIAVFVPIKNLGLRLGFRTVLIGIYLTLLIKRDMPLSEIPYINRFVKRHRK
ncbi:MAG: oligosaccharide flippase family protein [Candidatus Azobacteroides sp.]|nr:oligosaccharide flippase family protein [Candidatus Azobacteroides sp.]